MVLMKNVTSVTSDEESPELEDEREINKIACII
jgi:hypothetical protein